MLSLINKKAVQAIFISDKVDFRAKNITRYKEYHFIMIKESVHENHITILNVYVLNNRASKQIKKKTNRTARKNRQIHNQNQRFQHPSFNN